MLSSFAPTETRNFTSQQTPKTSKILYEYETISFKAPETESFYLQYTSICRVTVGLDGSLRMITITFLGIKFNVT